MKLQLVTKDNCHKFTRKIEAADPFKEAQPESRGLSLLVCVSVTLILGIYLGLFVAAMNTYYSCAKDQKWEYTNFLMSGKFHVECTVYDPKNVSS